MIARKPIRSTKSKDLKASKFIKQAGADDSHELQTITLNVPRRVLARITKCAQDRGLNRTAFMINASVEKCDSLDSAQ